MQNNFHITTLPIFPNDLKSSYQQNSKANNLCMVLIILKNIYSSRSNHSNLHSFYILTIRKQINCCIHNISNSFGGRCLNSSSKKTVNGTFLNCKKCIIILNVKLKSIYLPLFANYSLCLIDTHTQTKSHTNTYTHTRRHTRAMTFSCIVISTQG